MLDHGTRLIRAKKEGRYMAELSRQAELTDTYQREKSAWCKEFFAGLFHATKEDMEDTILDLKPSVGLWSHTPTQSLRSRRSSRKQKTNH
jgi:hypothetical protein